MVRLPCIGAVWYNMLIPYTRKGDAEDRCRDLNDSNAYVKRRDDRVFEPLLGLTLLVKILYPTTTL